MLNVSEKVSEKHTHRHGRRHMLGRNGNGTVIHMYFENTLTKITAFMWDVYEFRQEKLNRKLVASSCVSFLFAPRTKIQKRKNMYNLAFIYSARQ